MPRSLGGRIALAFTTVAVVSVLAVGAGLFVVLRGLHEDATQNALAQTVIPFVGQARAALAGTGDLRTRISALADSTPDGVSISVITADGRIVDLGDPVPQGTVVIPPSATRGFVTHGQARFADGRDHAWAAGVLRNPDALGPRAIVLSMLDRSGAEAIGDFVRTFPFVVIAAILAGAPIAWFLRRSVVAPLKRLAAATASVPSASVEPLPLDGPAELRELTARFNAMTAELAATRDRESELLANLRHDLRTPVTVIAGFASALADGTASGPDAGRAARAIGEEAGRLERLVGELGAIERLRAGAAGLHPESIDLADAVRETVDRFAPGAAATGVEVAAIDAAEARGGPATDLRVVADRLAVDRMLGNLVSNALAAVAQPGGHVWLEARLAPPADPADPTGSERVAVSVTDDGPGFPPGALPHVFERFYRADPARAGASTGLGLAIVLELARAHGGTATAEQMAPHGARVSVLLPRMPAGPPPA